MTDSKSHSLFNGSVWCNLDVALRNTDQLFRRIIRPRGLTVIEWYILRSLYTKDGQYASELARAVGRAATSFTPNLDKLQSKGFIERRPDKTDRRAVRIYLTDFGLRYREDVLESARQVDRMVKNLFGEKDFAAFQSVLSKLRVIAPEEFGA